MNKEAVVQICDEILLSYKKRNRFELVPVRWMNLEPIIQNEVRKRKTNINADI